MTDELNFVMRARREKLAALAAAGEAPFAYGYDRSHGCGAAVGLLGDAEEGPAVRLAGRIVAWRGHGKTIFAHLADDTGRVQLYFRQDQLGDRFGLLASFDLGDIIGVSGPLFRTRTGEVTVKVEAVTMLAKSLRPLPFGKEEVVDGRTVRHSGFADGEQRSRQRYADLAVHPEVRRHFAARSRMMTAIRGALDALGYLEVETPVLQPLYGGAAARPFTTHHNALDMPLFLRIADELYLKRLVVGGFDRVYEIGHDFRNEGIDRTHNPEFTMLEFYWAYVDYQRLMTFTEELLTTVAQKVIGTTELAFGEHLIHLAAPFRRLSLRHAAAEKAGEKLGRTVTVEELRQVDSARAIARALGVDAPKGAGAGKIASNIFEALWEKDLIQPTFVHDFPTEVSPLSKQRPDDPDTVERFELYIGGFEVANAFSELNDPVEQRRRFEAQLADRAAGDHEAHAMDEDYVRALEYGMPPAGGEGIGIDRLVMLLSNSQSIRDVILFPLMRPRAEEQPRAEG